MRKWRHEVDREKALEEKRIRDLPFPPELQHEHEKECVGQFIKATSCQSIETVECGICGESVMKRDIFHSNRFTLDKIPSRDLLLLENQENQTYLDEYLKDGLLLSPGGVVDDDKSVLCCKSCLSRLKNNKLPKFSIANGFQIGRTPPALTDLTLSEKLLISKCRPKMYIVKLRSTGGPQAQQRGLKGNTITFPQDVVKIAATLPANPDILVDHLRVIFIGNSRL